MVVLIFNLSKGYQHLYLVFTFYDFLSTQCMLFCWCDFTLEITDDLDILSFTVLIDLNLI